MNSGPVCAGDFDFENSDSHCRTEEQRLQEKCYISNKFRILRRNIVICGTR